MVKDTPRPEKKINLSSGENRSKIPIFGRQSSLEPPRPEKRQEVLQSNNKEIISINPSESSSLVPHSQKNLCNNPILIGDSSLSVTEDEQSEDEQSGRKCFMIGERGLKIEWQEHPRYWSWRSSKDSRFSTVAELLEVYFFDVKGNIETRILHPETKYAAYLVFKFANFREGFDGRSMKSIIYLEGRRQYIEVTSRELSIPRESRKREDQWMEIELGEFTNEQQNEGTFVCHLFDHNTSVKKSGITIQGIEVRPRI